MLPVHNFDNYTLAELEDMYDLDYAYSMYSSHHEKHIAISKAIQRKQTALTEPS